MQDHIDLWAAWRKGKVASFHNYTISNGDKDIQCERKSLQLAKAVSETWANTLFNERCLITIDGANITTDKDITSPTALFVKKIFDDNNLWVRFNEAQELKCSYGTVVYIPRIKGVDYETNSGKIIGNGKIVTDIITADMIIPLSEENGTIEELAIISERIVKGVKYMYIQMFVIENGLYVIKYNLVKFSDNGEYTEIDDLRTIGVKEFKDTARTWETNSPIKPFIIDKPNISNNINSRSPLGISIYANAIDVMGTCDKAYDDIDMELSLGRTRIFVAPTMTENRNGKPWFDPRDVIFQHLPQLDGNNDSVQKSIEVIQPELRIQQLEQALQLSLNMFSSTCGLGENYYRFNGAVYANQLQVISEQSTMYKTKTKHEITLELALYDFIRLIIDIGINTLKTPNLDPNVELKIKFDDSIVEDKGELQKRDMVLVSQGLMLAWEFRVKWFGETEEQAKAVLGEIDETTPDEYHEPKPPSAGRLEKSVGEGILK